MVLLFINKKQKVKGIYAQVSNSRFTRTTAIEKLDFCDLTVYQISFHKSLISIFVTNGTGKMDPSQRRVTWVGI